MYGSLALAIGFVFEAAIHGQRLRHFPSTPTWRSISQGSAGIGSWVEFSDAELHCDALFKDSTWIGSRFELVTFFVPLSDHSGDHVVLAWFSRPPDCQELLHKPIRGVFRPMFDRAAEEFVAATSRA